MEKEENGSTTPSLRPPVPAKKRSGAMSLLRAAMLAMRGTSSPKKTTVTIAATAIVDGTADTVINVIVGGMRPLHHRLDYERPPPPPPASLALDSYYDVHLPPPSPCSSEGMSRYASAEDLHALDTTENNEEAGGDGEPNAIDMKAEEFIAMFYKQMSLQRSDSLKMIDEETNIEESACNMV